MVRDLREVPLSDIEILLNQLGDSRITPMVLDTLDYVVPGEWENHTSLDAVIRAHLEVDDDAEVARIKERAEALYLSQPHYSRAVKVYSAADTVDKVAAAAVLANQVGESFALLNVLNRFTPKPETTQAVDAALKLTAEVVAFALLRGIPVTDLAEAKAFPATLATYAKADMMRLAAWVGFDGLLPLGPEFIGKIIDIVDDVDMSVITENALFAQLKGLMPGSTPDEQKGFILSTLESGADYVTEFVSSAGLTRENMASAVGTVMKVQDKGMDLLAATIDGSTNYFEHTGIQSVARILVHDAQQSLTDGETVEVVEDADPDAIEADGSTGGSWFKNAAVVAAGLGGGIAIGSMLFKGKAEAATPEEGAGDDDLDGLDFSDDDDDGWEDESDDELDDLDDNTLEARENALRMKSRRLKKRQQRLDEEEMRMMRRIRRARKRRRRGQGRRPGRGRVMGNRRGGRGGRGGGGGGRGGRGRR